MKIATKLYLLVASAVIGLLILGGLVLFEFGQINTTIVSLTQNIMPSVIKLGKIESQVSEARRAVLNHIMLNNPVEKEKYRLKFEEAIARVRKDTDFYKTSLAVDETDRQYINEVSSNLDAYASGVRKVFEISAGNKIDEARAYNSKYTAPIGNKITDAISKDVEYNRQLSDAAALGAVNIMQAGKIIIVAGVVCVAVGLFVFGLWLVRQIKKPLDTLNNGLVTLGQDLDFTQRIDVKGKDEVAESVAAVNQLLAILQQSLQQINIVGSQIHKNAQEVAKATQEMSVASSHVSSATSSMSAAVEQMTVSVNHVAEQSHQSDVAMKQSRTDALQGSEVVNKTISAIKETSTTVSQASAHFDELQNETNKIDSVVSVIRDIADQTNLLALNAAIEAARAGETGRGFAVVADEVRKLAERTTVSTQEISTMITAIQSGASQTRKAMAQVVQQVEGGISHAEEATTAIERILAGTHEVTGQVGEISTAMQEQSQASNNIAQQIEQVAQMTEESNASTQVTAEAAQHLQQQADALHDVIAKFKVA